MRLLLCNNLSVWGFLCLRNIMNKEELRNKILSKKMDMALITQLDSKDEASLQNLLKSYDKIWGDFIYLAQRDLGLID